MGETTGREEVRQPRAQIGIRRSVRIIIDGRLLQRLRADESRKIGILVMRQWHEPILGQLRLSPHRDGDLGGALHVHPSIIRRESVHRQRLHHAA